MRDSKTAGVGERARCSQIRYASDSATGVCSSTAFAACCFAAAAAEEDGASLLSASSVDSGYGTATSCSTRDFSSESTCASVSAGCAGAEEGCFGCADAAGGCIEVAHAGGAPPLPLWCIGGRSFIFESRAAASAVSAERAHRPRTPSASARGQLGQHLRRTRSEAGAHDKGGDAASGAAGQGWRACNVPNSLRQGRIDRASAIAPAVSHPRSELHRGMRSQGATIRPSGSHSSLTCASAAEELTLHVPAPSTTTARPQTIGRSIVTVHT